ncbi:MULTISPECIES: F0F1 ATP synthase subunit B [unclassified Butyrivibrio]|jgi:F-type H+-transporting ATPase subunit b|uniref:F0F1 ATP synthase subunit B n=1 Tax=unclassified Butyrivibrio TaxID=2639466 RepID=UPI0003B7907B|nr:MULTISPECIES: F0F1 ATP synthase subunit B [unclassified Butyrivibrio]SEG28101.1 F-type H+-transporting ATPase subunit b [Butyrivibrio sp. Su6]
MQLQALMMLSAENTQELVTLVPWTFIATIINLFIQMFLIKKFLFKPINDILEKRKNLADKTIREAREAKEEADSLKDQYEDSLTSAHAEAAKIVSDAQKEAQSKADALVKEAQEEAAGIKARAAADIEQERKKAVNEAKDEIGSLAMDIAGKVVEKEINEADHKKLIDEFINQVGA